LPLRVLAALALCGIGAIHLYLVRELPYSMQPTIHPLFIMTVAAALAFAAVFAVRPHWTVGLLAAGFAFSTMGGYVLTLVLPAGLFNFQEPGISYSGALSILCEAVAGLALLGWVVLDRQHRGALVAPAPVPSRAAPGGSHR
jgi:hypothetical protein